MIKSTVIAAVRARLEQDLQRTLAAARATEAAATDPESRSEGKYDTRGLEASYLAAGQSEQVEELAKSLRLIGISSNFPDFSPSDNIRSGALVEVDLAGERAMFLLAPAAGGLDVELDGIEVTVLAPGAPLRAKLDGRIVGDRFESPPMRIVAIS
ncbi:MAG: hypothetical protein KDN22_23630 [Verrucomicrobiae bacterium]|nr:hypothetical protein [Verrucomicrobiae bacterium]